MHSEIERQDHRSYGVVLVNKPHNLWSYDKTSSNNEICQAFYLHLFKY